MVPPNLRIPYSNVPKTGPAESRSRDSSEEFLLEKKVINDWSGEKGMRENGGISNLFPSFLNT